MCFATTSREQALNWAYQRGIRHGGDKLYVYEVEMIELEVDVNVHQSGFDGPITFVMSRCGRVMGTVEVLNKADYPEAFRD